MLYFKVRGVMRGWRNWQTRTFEGRVRKSRAGSTPVLRTKIDTYLIGLGTIVKLQEL